MIIATLLLGAMTLLVFVDDGPSREWRKAHAKMRSLRSGF